MILFSRTFSFLLLLCCLTLLSSEIKAINRIEGQVYDTERNPVADAFVELLSDVDSLLARTKTTSSGRFSFMGMSSGHFSIKVMPLGKNLLSQTQEVEINNQLARSDMVQIDFYLRVDKRITENVADKMTGVVFVQEVPPSARKLYTSGINNLEKSNEIGLSELEEAVKIFPDYFDALNRLGREYNSRKKYDKSSVYLARAADVYPRSLSTLYSFAYALYQLKRIAAAVTVAKMCLTLNADSPDIYLLNGTLLRINEDYKESEESLLKAKSLDKKRKLSEIYWQLGLLYNRLKRNSEAAEALEVYLKTADDASNKKEVEGLIAKLRTAKKE